MAKHFSPDTWDKVQAILSRGIRWNMPLGTCHLYFLRIHTHLTSIYLSLKKYSTRLSRHYLQANTKMARKLKGVGQRHEFLAQNKNNFTVMAALKDMKNSQIYRCHAALVNS